MEPSPKEDRNIQCIVKFRPAGWIVFVENKGAFTAETRPLELDHAFKGNERWLCVALGSDREIILNSFDKHAI